MSIDHIPAWITVWSEEGGAFLGDGSNEKGMDHVARATSVSG